MRRKRIKIIITDGGCFEVETDSIPEGVEVEIRDYAIQEETDETDDEGDSFIRHVYTREGEVSQ